MEVHVIKIITQNYENDKRVSASILNFFKKYKRSSIMKASNAHIITVPGY